VREALPIYKHDRGVIAAVLTLPAFGLIGYGAAVWRNRRDAEQLAPWVILGLLSFIATALLFWQTRAGPAAQMLAIPGAAALTWLAIAWGQRQEALIVRVAVTVVSFFVISGLAVQNIVGLIRKRRSRTRRSRRPTTNVRRWPACGRSRCRSPAMSSPMSISDRG
jgi:hypothetical protein